MDKKIEEPQDTWKNHLVQVGYLRKSRNNDLVFTCMAQGVVATDLEFESLVCRGIRHACYVNDISTAVIKTIENANIDWSPRTPTRRVGNYTGHFREYLHVQVVVDKNVISTVNNNGKLITHPMEEKRDNRNNHTNEEAC